ncbi:MAG: hypothetical protein AAF664_18795, partial [Planctomycetota bacterium]
SSTATAGKVGIAKIFGVGASAGISGAIVGTIGGIAGAAFGSYMAYRNSPYQSQKRLVIRYFLVLLVAIAIFCSVVAGLVWKQTSGEPLSGGVYAIVLMSCIIGFQVLLLGTGFFLKRKYETLQNEGEQNDEPVDPRAQVIASHPFNQGVSAMSRLQILGRPLIDIQLGARRSDVGRDKTRIARGWIAIGDIAHGWLFGLGNRATGLIAIGSRSFGIFAFGAISIGVISVGALPLGLVSGGGLALGLFAFGGLAMGYWAMGGIAAGGFSAGGIALGVEQALGGMAGSMGPVKAGYAIAGDGSDAAVHAIEQHWISTLMTEQVQTFAFQLVVLILVPVFLTVIMMQILKQRVERESALAPSYDHQTLKHDHWSSRVWGVLGSLFGCTAWTVGIGYKANRIDVTLIAAAMYGLAWVFLLSAVVRDRKATQPSLGVYFGFLILWLVVMANLAVAYQYAGIIRFDSIHLFTVAIGAPIVFVMHAAMTVLVGAKLDWKENEIASGV